MSVEEKIDKICEIFNELYDDATEEIERLKEELKYTVPVVEYNKTITKHIKEKEQLHSIVKEVREYIEEHIKYECDNAFNGMQFYSHHLYGFNKKELLEILDKEK